MRLNKFIAALAFAFVMVIAAPAVHASAAPVKMADGNMFDAQYYAANNPDVVAIFGTGADILYLHYSLFGKAEGRLPYAPGSSTATAAPATGGAFDAAFYASRYPDVVATFGNDPAVLKAHYDLFGKNEGRFPNAASENAAGIAVATTAPVQAVVNDSLPLTGLTMDQLGPRYWGIQADITLSGTGTGYFAKIAVQDFNTQVALSFGIQYDLFGDRPYNNQTVYMCENVINNLPGGQHYTRHGLATLGVPQNLMIVVDNQTGMVYLYVNGTQVGQAANTYLMTDKPMTFAEGCARLDGDTVNAVISNIRFKRPGTANTSGDTVYCYNVVPTNPGIAISSNHPNSFCSSDNVSVNGMIVGLNGLDWDSAFANVSGIAAYDLWN